MAVLDANDVPIEGASYELSAGSGIPTDTRSEERELFGSDDSDSSSDDCMLPMYACAGGCDSTMVTGRGMLGECQVYSARTSLCVEVLPAPRLENSDDRRMPSYLEKK